jgi:hypothetical protein
MLRLKANRLFPCQPKPAQILENIFNIVGTATNGINILDPQKKPPALPPRRLVSKQGRSRMPDMKKPCWAWRESRDDHDFFFGIVFSGRTSNKSIRPIKGISTGRSHAGKEPSTRRSAKVRSSSRIGSPFSEKEMVLSPFCIKRKGRGTEKQVQHLPVE